MVLLKGLRRLSCQMQRGGWLRLGKNLGHFACDVVAVVVVAVVVVVVVVAVV